MKLTNNFSVILFFIVNITFAQDWVKTDITQFASINFPVKSKITETQRETVYTAEDKFGFYIASITKLTNQESSQIKKEDIPSIYQGVAQGAIQAANAELVSMEEISIQNTPALELEYSTTANPNLPSQRFKRIIYSNQSLITMDFWPLTNQKNVSDKKKSKYFNSFLINSIEVSKNPMIISQESDKSSRGYESGLFIGQIIFYVILIAFLIGIFLLIRYLIKKKSIKNAPVLPVKQTNAKTLEIICQNCNSENKSNSKYCSKCGYELTKI